MNERVQVAVIGGGPAGLASATAAAAAGARVVLLDENRATGGQLRYRSGRVSAASHGSVGASHAKTLARLAREAGVEIRTDCRVWGVFAENAIGVERGESSAVVQSDRIVFANGSVDRTLPFPGGSLPGVFTARALQILFNIHCVRPGRRFAVIGGDSVVSELARDIDGSGGEIVATFPELPVDLVASGDTGVERVTAQGQEHAVDVVVVAAGRLPDAGLALMAECAAGYDAELGGFVPKVDDAMQTSVPGIFAAGDCVGPCDIETSLAEGTFAGVSVAASLGLVADAELTDARRRYKAATGERAARLMRVAGSHVQVDRVPVGATVK